MHLFIFVATTSVSSFGFVVVNPSKGSGPCGESENKSPSFIHHHNLVVILTVCLCICCIVLYCIVLYCIVLYCVYSV